MLLTVYSLLSTTKRQTFVTKMGRGIKATVVWPLTPKLRPRDKRRLSWRESAEKFAIYEVCELMDRKGNWIAAEGMWWKFMFLYHCSFTRLVAILSLDKLSRFRALRLLLTGLMLYRCEYIYWYTSLSDSAIPLVHEIILCTTWLLWFRVLFRDA